MLATRFSPCNAPFLDAGLRELRLDGTNLTALPELPSAPHLTMLSVRNSRKLNLAVADVQLLYLRLPHLAAFLVGDLPWGQTHPAGLLSSLVQALVWLARNKPSLRIS